MRSGVGRRPLQGNRRERTEAGHNLLGLYETWCASVLTKRYELRSAEAKETNNIELPLYNVRQLST